MRLHCSKTFCMATRRKLMKSGDGNGVHFKTALHFVKWEQRSCAHLKIWSSLKVVDTCIHMVNLFLVLSTAYLICNTSVLGSDDLPLVHQSVSPSLILDSFKVSYFPWEWTTEMLWKKLLDRHNTGWHPVILLQLHGNFFFQVSEDTQWIHGTVWEE